MASLAMGALVYGVNTYGLPYFGSIGTVLAAVAIGGISYVALLIVCREFSLEELQGWLKKRKAGKRND